MLPDLDTKLKDQNEKAVPQNFYLQNVHPWFVACQFHPEFTSNPRTGHPLFTAYVKAALAHQGVN